MSSMTTKKKERRETKRAFFTIENNITAKILLKDKSGEETESISVILLSICIGGLSFLIPRFKFKDYKVGDRVKVKSLQTPPPIGIIDEIELEIKYIIDEEHTPRLVIGGRFTDILQLHRKRIFDYVNQQLTKLGINK